MHCNIDILDSCNKAHIVCFIVITRKKNEVILLTHMQTKVVLKKKTHTG